MEATSAVADRMGDPFLDPSDVDGHEVVVTASAGVSVYQHDGTDADTVLKQALREPCWPYPSSGGIRRRRWLQP